MSDCSELKVIIFDVSFLPCNGVIIERELGTINVMLTDCTLLLFFISCCQKLLIFRDIITLLTWQWPKFNYTLQIYTPIDMSSEQVLWCFLGILLQKSGHLCTYIIPRCKSSALHSIDQDPHTKGGQKYSWLQLCSVIQGIKDDCKIGKVPSITLSIMWIHISIYRGGISGMVNIHNDLNKVVQTQVIFKFWSTDGFGPKTFKYSGPWTTW